MENGNAKKYIFGLFQIILIFVALNVAADAATYTVTNTNDGVAIPGSLREAITQANATSDATFTILINIGAGGVKTISPNSPLPAINLTNGTNIVIDATAMPGYAGVPLLQLNGSFAGASANGLNLVKGNLTVKGLIINNFSQYGILTTCQSGSCGLATLNIYGCYIGTDPTGTLAAGNANGIRIQTSGGVVNVGGTAANQRNIISGNDANGIVIDSPGSDDTINIVNNYIGTNVGGTAAVPNGINGIYILDSAGGFISYPDVLIGGPNAVQRNVISGNGSNGIRITENTNKIYIKGNYIGTNAAGTGDLGNVANGVLADGPTANFTGIVVGGAAAGEGNTISGNNLNGVRNEQNDEMEITGNRIGTNAAGTAAVPNTQDGVSLIVSDFYAATKVTANTISGNGDDGIGIGADSTGLIEGNRIGVNSAATSVLPNGGDGISVSGSCVIGGVTAAAKNIISGNTGDGIALQSPASECKIKGNYIGTNASGTDLGNSGDGISTFAAVYKIHVGGVLAGEGNSIAFNNSDGVALNAGFGSFHAEEVLIRGNSIYSNSGIGIDLGPTNGVTPNDLNDADTGPNGVQNYPVLQLASGNTLHGSLNSEADKGYHIDLYRVDACDASGHGEGRYYLGSVSANTNSGGNASFTATGISMTAGQIIVATASKVGGFLIEHSTSEFSPCLTVSLPPGDVKLSSATYSGNESNPSIAIIVSRTGGTTGTVTVDYTTSNGTATAGEDYTATSGTLTFLTGESGKLLTIPVTNDTRDEPDETLTLTLSNPTGGAQLISPSSATITLSDNDNPPAVSINDVSTVEGNENLTPFTFTVTLAEASGFATSVNWATAGATANPTNDFQANSGTVNFAAGETSKQVQVQVLGETLVEINETFNVNLSSPTLLTLGDGSGTGTIVDDDNPGKFSFSLAPYNVGEAAGSAVVTVIRTNGDAGTATVDYTTGGGTATPFADFTPVSNTLIFLDGETQKTFVVPVLEDQIAEQTESVHLLLSGPTGGATLGVMTAVVNILDNDSGTPLAISGSIKKADATPLAGASVNLTGTHTATTTTDANGEYSFSSLTPAGNYAVTPSAIGYTFTPINHQYANLSASVTNARFTATPAPSRALRVVGVDTVPGQAATAIVELVAQGDENTVGFSLSFDPAVLSNPQVALMSDAASGSLIVNDSQAGSGKVGVIIALPAGQMFAAGTRQVATLTFNSAITALYNTPLNFGDAPVQKQIVNVNADPLPTAYTDGSITFAQGFEGDVAPRPTGSMNGSVTVADFTQIGRFVAGLNAPDQTNEFQRSDVAPRISKGNGLLTVSDYTQAGRYAAGLDPVQTAGGATAASLVAPESNLNREGVSPEGLARMVSVVEMQTSPGLQVSVPVKIDSQGDENSFGFSVSYDQTKLSNPLVTLGTDTPGATLIVNTSQTGKVGVLLGLPAGTSLATGERHIVTVRFDVAAGAAAGQTPLAFGDQPIAREVVDASVNVLTAGYTDGFVNILGPTAATVTVGGRITDQAGRGIGNAIVTMVDPDGTVQLTATATFGYYQFEGVEVGRTYIFSVNSKRYQFEPASRVVTIFEQFMDIDFTAIPNSSLTEDPKEEK